MRCYLNDVYISLSFNYEGFMQDPIMGYKLSDVYINTCFYTSELVNRSISRCNARWTKKTGGCQCQFRINKQFKKYIYKCL